MKTLSNSMVLLEELNIMIGYTKEFAKTEKQMALEDILPVPTIIISVNSKMT